MPVKMPMKWRKERGQFFGDAIRRAKDSERGEFMARVAECRELYYREAGGFDTDETDGPWENSADLHIPVIMEKVETATPKIMSAMWRANPFVNVSRPGGSNFNPEQVKNVERYLSWAFRNDIPNFYMTFENFIRNMCIDGTAIAKVRWERKTRRAIESFFVDMYTTETDENGEESPPIQRALEDILGEIFGLGDVTQTLYDYKKIDESTFAVKFTEMGVNYEGRVELLEAPRIDQIRVRVFRTVVEHESPIIDNVPLEDLLFPFRSTNLQDAQWLAHKTWYSYREIEALVKSGEWTLTKEQLKTIKASRTLIDEDSEDEDRKDKVLGGNPEGGQGAPSKDHKLDFNKLLVWEIYTEDYLDNEEVSINCIHFMPDALNVIASTEYHDEIFPHGKRPFVSAVYLPVAGRVYGIGMASILFGVNLSIDHTINSIHNNMTITTNPMFFYSPMAIAQSGGGMLRVKPGEGVPIMNPREVYFPNFAQQPLEMYHATYAQMQGIADSLTFSPSIGGSSNYRNAPRTARGTMALMDAAEEKLSTIVEQLQATAWKEIVQHVSALYGALLTIDKWYMVTGETEARHITPRELRENFIFEFSGSLTSVNRDIQRTLIQQMFMTLKDDVDYQNDPTAKNNLRRVFVQAFGENVDVESLLPSAPGEGGLPHPMWSQEEENRSLSQGIFVQVLPRDNHNEHLGQLQAFMESKAFQALPDYTKGIIYAHGKAHEQALQQQMAAVQKTADTQGTAAADMQMQEQVGGPAAPQPGVPTQGQPAMGGELSSLGGLT